MKRRFKIRKWEGNPYRPWLLTMNGWDVRDFVTWEEAITHLIHHWYCECLHYMPTEDLCQQ